MSVKIGINGFGRIGRNLLRASLNDPGIEIVAVNDITDPKTLAHLLKYDSVFGTINATVGFSDNAITVNRKPIRVFKVKDPAEIDWSSLGIQVVVESTGLFTKAEDAKKHLKGTVKKVIISAPAKGEDITIVLGVNENMYDAAKHNVLSNASCTTNCLAPAAKVINDSFKILKGSMTTIHAYTNDQKILDTQEFRTQIDWPRVHLFWGDERAVPPDDPESNYGMVRRELLLRVPIPPANVHRMEAETQPIGRGAHAYEDVLRQSLDLDGRGFPVFHLVLLGVGTDGHTASLFPGARFLRETSRWVSTPTQERLGTRRMTITLPVIEAAEQVLFLVTGSQKAAMLRVVLCGNSDRELPAQMVHPRHGERIFLVDEAAARLLPAEAGAAPAAPAETPKKHP